MKYKLFVFFCFFGVSNILFAQNDKAQLSNFRIENNQVSRIYFDVNGDISELTTEGFIVSGRTINGINKTENYFSVNNPFTFWDNNTIRLENLNSEVSAFSLQHIRNKIVEPSALNEEWFVDAGISSSGDGKREDTAFKTINEAIKAITQGGAIVHIKAGNYGAEYVKLINELPSNSSSQPYVFQGYRDTPGDLNNKNYYSFSKGKSLVASAAPLLDGGDRSKGIGITIAAGGTVNRDYIIVRNIQIQNFKKGVVSNSGSNSILENCIVRGIGTGTSDNGIHFYSGENNKIINCTSINASVAAFNISGNFNSVENCEAYGEDSGSLKMDYYYTVKGRNSIFLNNYSKKILADGKDWEHGFSLSGDKSGDTEYNLIENQETTNGVRGIELRRAGCSKNVVRGAYSHDTELGVQIRDGANNNIIENSYFLNVSKAIDFSATSEIGLGSAYNNIIKNVVISNARNVVFHRGNTTSDKPEVSGNKFYNLTIYNSSLFWNNYLIEPKMSSNEWVNCNIVNVKNQGFSKGQTFSNSNFFGSWQSLVGGSNISENPQFVNADKNDFRLKTNSKLINAGKKIISVKKDFNGKGRPQGTSHDIGAFEFEDNTTSSIKADAGPDQQMCLGENVILSAQGGSSYRWSTGETTSSITVSPSESTIYTVTVLESGQSDIDEVKVNVNLVVADAGNDQTIESGESVSLTASGGDSYLWSNGKTTKTIVVNPSKTSVYSVKVTSGNCEDTDEVKVNVIPVSTALNASISENQQICIGESVTIIASGGTNFLWNTGETTASINVTPNKTTTYSVQVSNGAESEIKSSKVNVIIPKADAGVDKIIDFGSSVTLTASGGDTFLWSTGETTKSINVQPNEDTIYEVTTTTGNCSASDQVQVRVNPEVKIFASIIGPEEPVCSGQTIELTAQGGTSFLWNTGDTADTISLSLDETTILSVTVYNGNQSEIVEFEIIVEDCNGIALQEDDLSNQMNIYPNPTDGVMHINIESRTDILDMNLLSLEGKIVYFDKMDYQKDGLSKQIDVSGLSKGIYFLRLYNSNNYFVKKVMIL